MSKLLLALAGGLIAGKFLLTTPEMWCEHCGTSNKNSPETCRESEHIFSPVNWRRELRYPSGYLCGSFETLGLSGNSGDLGGIKLESNLNRDLTSYSKDGRLILTITIITDHPFYSCYDNKIFIESRVDLKTGKFTFFRSLSDPMDIDLYQKRIFK